MMPPTEDTTEPTIEIQALSHRYPFMGRGQSSGRPMALDGVSLTVLPGEIFGILGPNGSGKSTLFRILATMLRPSLDSSASQGYAKVLGFDVIQEPEQVRQGLGVVFQSPSLDGKLTAEENLTYHGLLYGLSGRALKQRTRDCLDLFGLWERRSEPVERFSGGMRRKVEVAKALLHAPAVLLMDEPATGLDPVARRDLWQTLMKLRERQSTTIVLTTHLMDEADRCDRLAIMARGKTVAIDTPSNLKAQIGGDVVTIEPDEVDPVDLSNRECAAHQLLKQITERFGPWDPNSEPIITEEGRIRFEKPDGARIGAEVAAAFPGRIRSLNVSRPSLEDVFMHLTGETLHADES